MQTEPHQCTSLSLQLLHGLGNRLVCKDMIHFFVMANLSKSEYDAIPLIRLPLPYPTSRHHIPLESPIEAHEAHAWLHYGQFLKAKAPSVAYIILDLD